MSRGRCSEGWNASPVKLGWENFSYEPGEKKVHGSLTVPKGDIKEKWRQHSAGPVAAERGVMVLK